ncbi:MAG: Asp-tRNA(Asn)/Glu-tRNA(Gln) amidotransferase subunit GatB, partial [Planctomycetota bacterium]
MTSQQKRESVNLEDVTVVIGLEVHVQLQTESKLFCGCSTQYGNPPNTQTCVVCVGLPGSLPVINQQALNLAIKTGLALDCQIARHTKWDRKNYFYPDLPKGYQISQFDQPICGPGELTVSDPKGKFESTTVRIERAHLEEDAGKSIHGADSTGCSQIDLNRTGTPLLEIVTRPDLRSPAAAKAFLQELKLILTYIGVSDCNMQQGNLRCDGNINLHINFDDQTIATPIVEIKNMNSFRNAERALAYEAQRQLESWQLTGVTIEDAPKQTRGWSDTKQATTVQREKEESADYRYFPDPDLISVRVSESEISAIQSNLETLPESWRQELIGSHQLNAYDANVIVGQGREVVDYFLAVAAGCGNSKMACNWITQEVLRYLNEENLDIDSYPIPASGLIELLSKINTGKIDQTRAKEVLEEMISSGISVQAAMDALGIQPVDEGELEALCQQLVLDNPAVIAQIRDGNTKAIGALIGKSRKLNPNANPGIVREKLLQL